jgi:PAS domain S-box-containing protein
VTSELEPGVVLARLVEEVARLVEADAADFYVLEPERHTLRCAAVEGLPEEVLGFEFPAEAGVAGEALARGRAVLASDYESSIAPVVHQAYEGFRYAMVAPVTWAGEPRGVLGVGSRPGARPFDERDLDLLETFAGLAALALRNAQAFEERTHQARVQRGFFRIASVLAEPLSLPATLEAVAQAAAEAHGGSSAAMLGAAPDGLELVGAHALPDALRDLLARAPLRDASLGEAARAGKILAASDLAHDDRFDAAWRDGAVRAGVSSALVIPVERREADQNGVVLVFCADARRFADDDIALARQLAGAARGALERASLYEEERRARGLAQQLARTGSLLATELDPAAVLDEVVRRAPGLLDVEACVIRVVEEDELVISAAEGDGTVDLLGLRTPLGGRLSGEVAQAQLPVNVADAAADAGLALVDPVLDLGFRAFLGVPLAGREGALHGVLAVYGRRPRTWRNEEVEALRALAGNAAAALSNAELYQRVALANERSNAILTNIADGIVAVNRDGDVVLWNRAAEEITRVPAEEALGRPPAEVLGRGLDAEAAEPEPGDRLVRIVRGDEEVWLSVTEAVMRDPAGVVAGRIYAFRDISADRFVEEMKSDFVAAVSQELRRPLTSIYGFAETLLRQDVLFDEQERRTFLEYIASESERLTSIVDALLNVARLDTGDLQVALGPTSVAPLLQEAVAAVEPDAASNGHRFVVDVPEELAAEADREKLRLVLTHLLDNAVRYSPDGGTVTVAARPRGEAVEISVADEGVGIPLAEQERIFRKFYRGEGGGARAGAGGTGLGLFIARGLVTAMGGRMWVSSSEGAGSRFSVELRRVEASVPTGS